MEITLCLIVRDEEKRLPTCLQSFKTVYSRLVIVDTGSIDSTQKIAKEWGADVYDFTWCDDFSAARNFALQQVKTQWVMVVDVDDVMRDETKKKLLEELKKLSKDTRGIFMPYSYSNVNNKSGFTTYLPRIWKTEFSYQYTLPIHEYLDIPKADIPHFIRLPLVVVHQKESDAYGKSIIRNLGILEKAIKKDPSQSRLLFYLGRENKSAGNYKDALDWYMKFTRISGVSNDELNRAYLGMGECYSKLGLMKKAKEAYLQSIQANSLFAEGYLLLGDMALQQKKYKQAARWYLEATKKQPPQTHVFVNMQLYNGHAKSKLCEALYHIKEFAL